MIDVSRKINSEAHYVTTGSKLNPVLVATASQYSTVRIYNGVHSESFKSSTICQRKTI